MKKIFIILLTILLSCNITLVCGESATIKENLNKATVYYNSDNYQNALDYYVKAVQTRESNSGTTYYRLAYSWENVNPNASKYFSKFYSIAAYCFERDNDTENKYYSYSVKKEEKFKITHTNLDENKIQKIINNYLTEKKINYKKNKSSKKKDGESSDVLPIIIAAIVALFCTKKFGSKSGKATSQANKNFYKQEISEDEISQNNRIISKYLYQCSKCGKILKSTTTPQSSTTCIENNYHSWKKIAEDGNNIYQCKKCGLAIGCKSTPQSTTTCINQNYHSWTKIAEKGDNLYECRKCGKTLKCKSTPQSTTTCENRSYHSWHKI